MEPSGLAVALMPDSGESPVVTAMAAAALAATHAITPSLRGLSGIPRSIWLSLFGGVSVAYVFVHLLPELARGQEHLRRLARTDQVIGLDVAERHVYLVALTGLAAFYGLERMAKRHHPGSPAQRGAGPASAASGAVFWIHIAAFAVYNALVGYLLIHRPDANTRSLVLFAAAMALHFVVTDVGLHEHHGARYHRRGRWVLVGSVLGGAALGWAVPVSKAALVVLLAFLAGGVMLNVLKEELPPERQSRFWAFAVGLSAYSALLLAA